MKNNCKTKKYRLKNVRCDVEHTVGEKLRRNFITTIQWPSHAVHRINVEISTYIFFDIMADVKSRIVNNFENVINENKSR